MPSPQLCILQVAFARVPGQLPFTIAFQRRHAKRPPLGDVSASVVTDPEAFLGVGIDAVSSVTLLIFGTSSGSASSLVRALGTLTLEC